MQMPSEKRKEQFTFTIQQSFNYPEGVRKRGKFDLTFSPVNDILNITDHSGEIRKETEEIR